MKKQRVLWLVEACLVASLWSCVGDVGRPGDETPASALREIELRTNADGELEVCDDSGCKPLPNPNGCTKLVISVDVASGASCERCYAADGELITESCGPSTVLCDVITIPEPDCVVCAYLNGAIVYSSCAPPPEPEVCPNFCPQILCAPGYSLVQHPDECCGRCEPDPICPAVGAPPPDYCMGGEVVWVTDENGCKTKLLCRCPDGAYSEAGSCVDPCALEACLTIAVACPDGYFLDTRWPTCCGTCTPKPDLCPMYDLAPGWCAGGKLDEAIGPDGCPKPICRCADGSVADNGLCTDVCSTVLCAADAMMACPPGYHTDYSYPSCCGACVPDQPCRADFECNSEQVCHYIGCASAAGEGVPLPEYPCFGYCEYK